MQPEYPIQQRTEDFAVRAIEFVRTIPKQDSAGWILLSQFLRAATSIGANVAEGRGSPSRNDFAHFHSHALKSSNEAAYWLRLFDRTNIDNNKLRTQLAEENVVIGRIIGRIVVNSKKKK